MRLQGRNLSIRMQGADVALLNGELAQLGFDIPEEGRELFGRATEQAVTDFQRAQRLEPTGVVDEQTATQINAEVDARSSRIVRGRVREADGSPLVGGTVRAYDRDLRRRQELGAARTDRGGRFEIAYARGQFSRAEKDSADLFFEIGNQDGVRFETFQLLRVQDRARSKVDAPQIIFNAGAEETVEVTIGEEDFRGPSEYERLVEELTPLLEDISFADLKEDEEHQDITFLARETGTDRTHIEFLVIAARLTPETDLPAAVFYGLFRQNLPTELPALLAQHPQVLRGALESAIRTNIIPARLRGDIDTIFERFQQLIVEQAFEEPAETGKTSVSALLSTTIPSEELQQKVLTAYVKHEGPIQDFWTALRADPQLTGLVDDLQFTLQLATFTQNHLPLVRELQKMRREGIFGSLRDLAKLDMAAWIDLISSRAIGFPSDTAGRNDAEKTQNYATSLARIIEAAFPAAVIADRVGKDDIPGKEDLVKFFSNNSDFEFSTNIEKYLRDRGEIAVSGVTDKERLKRRLKGMQRVFKLTPRYDEMKVLLADGRDSARSIVRMGRSAFVNTYGGRLGGEAQAGMVYAKASHSAAMALALFGKYAAPFYSTAVTQQPLAVVDEIPNWATLFGPPVACECVHCRSVYSPAAYLVDILKFLGDHASPALARLLSRRPDIGNIELSCENTNTPVPYVDLVNEVLESAIAPVAFSLEAGFQSDLDDGSISDSLNQAFKDNGALLSDQAAVAVEAQGSRWAITDMGWRYHIEKKPNELQVSAAAQTHGTPQELGADPQFVNQQAYDVLGKEVYPWDLPFDLWTEEARVYLDHLGVPRHRLMGIFHKNESPPELNDIAIASEYLYLTTFERDIITGNASQQPWGFWGLEQNVTFPDPADNTKTITEPWHNHLRRVPVFLQRSGLSFKELLELWETKFVHPAGTIGADPPNSCDLEDFTITVLTEEELDRAHRFLRLRRKMRWTIRELDKVIAALQPDHNNVLNLSEDLLKQLSHIQRLRADLKVPLVRMMSWWSLIDTTGHDAEDKSLYEQLFQNKTVVKLAAAEEPGPFALNSDGTELLNTTGKVSENIPALLAALRLSEVDLSRLLTAEFTDANGLADPTLNLANLSRLYRIASFTRALKLSIWDFLSLKALTGINPFADESGAVTSTHTANTLQFAEKVRKIRASGFRVIELDYLLRHVFEDKDGIAPAEGSVAQTLNEIRDGLQKIIADNAKAPDLTGDLTRKNLVLLKWDNWIVDEVIATLNGSKPYKSTLDALPADLDLPGDIPDEPKGLKQKVSYDAGTKELRFTGPMTKAERDTLLLLSTDPAYQSAVNALFGAPRLFISQKMKVFELPPFEAPLDALPQSVVFPPELKGRIYYDAEAKNLRFTGWMTEAEREKLLELSDDADYAAAINSLFDAPGAFVPEGKNAFLTEDDAAELFDADTAQPATAEERFGFVLDRLLPYIRRVLSESLVKQKLGDALKLEAQTSERLLMQWVNSPKHPDQKSITEFLAPVFAESNANVKLTAAAFPDQFETYALLHKIAMLVEKFKLTPEQVRWLFDYGPEVGWLDLNTLPFAPVAADTEQYARWERLADLFALRDQLPLGEALLSKIFRLARTAGTTVDKLLHELSERSRWKEEDLQSLTGVQGFGLIFPDAYKDERALGRLTACFATLRRLGVSASQVTSPDSGWIKPEMTLVEARSIKQAVKAKYEDEQWLTIAKPLKDILREKQRSALVSYWVFKLGYDNSNDLFAHFLVDVEMSPCAMTSRVKQASGSVQLFVQRCLMGLEKDIALDEETARQWKWRKNYRVWEANRKVFLYPENWIEPELRDDKSPFFKDLENQLLQNEVTKDTAEDAFLSYLEKLNDVARLDIVGMHHQVEFVPHPGGEKEVTLDILHVFGRTRGNPRIYYYRQRIRSFPSSYHWTSWEKVDVDIEGDHLIPVIWNRRLHIFWPVFTEKAEATIPDAGNKGEEPTKHWQIQIAWSEHKDKTWSAKKVSQEPLELDDLGFTKKQGFVFKASGDLTIRCYRGRTVPDIKTETVVLDSGAEAGVKTPDLGFKIGVIDPIGEFSFRGCNGAIISSKLDGKSIFIPRGTLVDYMMFVEDVTGLTGVTVDTLILKSLDQDIPALNKTPGTFRVLAPHQDTQFASQRPFFYQDDTRTFFVVPMDVSVDLPEYFKLPNAAAFFTVKL